MGNKKDPGKFTVRFNMMDPQQSAAVELLNRQGRCKAQFITNAVLFYVNAAAESTQSGSSIFRHMMMGVQTESQRTTLDTGKAEQDADWNRSLEDADMDSIRRTMDAFHAT